jgi:hypothetical protein
MKRLVFLCLLLAGLARAQTVPFDINTAYNTAKPMMAAISAATGLNFNVNYVSGYGMSYIAQSCGVYSRDWAALYKQIRTITDALGQTVKGLRSSDWFSLSVTYPCYQTAQVYVTMRVPGDAVQRGDLWQIWANGVQQTSP